MLQVQERSFTVEDIYTLYKGEKINREYDTLEYFDVFLERLKRLVGVDLAQATWNNPIL